LAVGNLFWTWDTIGFTGSSGVYLPGAALNYTVIWVCTVD
jgi:hypothetical protein